MTNNSKIRQRILIVAWGVYIAASALFMMPTNANALGAVSQAFTTSDASLVPGTMVSLETSGATVVEKATSLTSEQLLGVTASNPLVALGGEDKQAQVVVSGLTPTLVSNINGDIHIGDKITASPIEGVGMKAISSTEIVGTAESNLDNTATTTESVVDKDGKTTKVQVGLIAVQVNVSYYAAPQGKLNDIVPTFLVNVGNAVAGKSVSPLRILIGFSGLLIGFVIVGIMIQAGVRAGMISLGRNPLASKVLRRSLIDVLATSVGLLAITVVVFYLILTA